jgi:hypothetical protein
MYYYSIFTAVVNHNLLIKNPAQRLEQASPIYLDFYPQCHTLFINKEHQSKELNYDCQKTIGN